MKRYLFLSGNTLKIIAAFCMLVDHIGVMFFPGVQIFRIVGRIALPIFAFMIAEGCRYTRNKLRYFLTVFILGVLCQVVYFIYDGDTYLSILITFSISILLIYLFQFFKSLVFDKYALLFLKVLTGILFVASIISVYFLNEVLEIDYGFYGCMMPLFASAFHFENTKDSNISKFIASRYFGLASMSVCMLLLALSNGTRQFYSFLAIPILLLYNGKRGKTNMKYFFYIFYPAHLLILELINQFIKTRPY